jgi:hypothetical protein
MLRQALGFLLIVALFGAGITLLTPEGRRLLDRASIAYTRWQNHSYYQSGLPLPGTPDLAKFDDLPHLPLVGAARSQARRGRPAGA